MDSSDEPPLCRFGTPLDPLEEDDVPSKKRIAIEDQIVTDENGKRRFHGAFTGGFSAGFWNTVGSLEGWKPQSFKSSRGEKAEKRKSQLPTDFMDDEDLGEFGIAPQRVQARMDFATTDSNRKRKSEIKTSGPIPGVPVLQQLLEPSREKVAVRLLRRMGWKPGQGIGARQTKSEKTRSNGRNNRELYVMKIYGCGVQPNDQPIRCSSNDSSDHSDEENLTFAPDDFEPFVCSIKDNTFGLGYSGLNRQSASDAKSHINLFGPLEVMGKSNKKLSIRGQAFGVGALEEEDEDIYAKDDMSKYDFSLSDRKKRDKQKLVDPQDQTIVEGFAEAIGKNSNIQKTVHIINLKSNFQPRNWSHRKTRFEPLTDDKKAALHQNDVDKNRGLGRHKLNPNERGNLLETREHQEVVKNKSYLQHISEKYQEREDKNKKMLELLSSRADSFVKGGLITNSGVETFQEKDVEISEAEKSQNSKILSQAKEITKSLGSSSGVFKPFATNEGKQERYEKFITANLKKDEEIKAFLHTIQPLHLSEWDREMERKEFIQARSIYKPLNGLMSERFVSKSTTHVSKDSSTKQDDKNLKVTIKRTKNIWKPSAIICKRFNIPEPFGGTLTETKVPKKNKFSVFDYIENSINSKSDFVTPVIIPKHIEKPKEIKNQYPPSESVSTTETSSGNVLPSNSNLVSDSKVAYKESVSELDASQSCHAFTKDLKKNKSELELKIEKSRNMHPSEKKDLFMSIFDSSSDDEDDGKINATNTLETALSEEIVKTLIKPSVPINALRNNSPPRGIFAALLSNSAPKEAAKNADVGESINLGKITFKSKQERHIEKVAAEPDDTYGPKIPTQFANQGTNLLNDEAIDKKLAELLAAKYGKGPKVIEKWVEKSEETLRKNKKLKKEKKKKSRQDREKSKHKKLKKHKKNKK